MTTAKKTATKETRRDFLQLTAGAFGAVGAGAVVWPFIDSLNPAKDTLALATTEVDLTPVAQGQSITVMWRGKPVFIRHRTEDEIKQAREDDAAALPDKENDADRVKKDQWSVMIGICTQLGCVPVGQNSSDAKGEFGGWFCPCHGSHYDTSGSIRKGPAPKNQPDPPYEFTGDNLIKIG